MCKIIIGNQHLIIILMQFRLNKLGGAREKLYQADQAVNRDYQADQAVNRDPGGTPAAGSCKIILGFFRITALHTLLDMA